MNCLNREREEEERAVVQREREERERRGEGGGARTHDSKASKADACSTCNTSEAPQSMLVYSSCGRVSLKGLALLFFCSSKGPRAFLQVLVIPAARRRWYTKLICIHAHICILGLAALEVFLIPAAQRGQRYAYTSISQVCEPQEILVQCRRLAYTNTLRPHTLVYLRYASHRTFSFNVDAFSATHYSTTGGQQRKRSETQV